MHKANPMKHTDQITIADQITGRQYRVDLTYIAQSRILTAGINQYTPHAILANHSRQIKETYAYQIGINPKELNYLEEYKTPDDHTHVYQVFINHDTHTAHCIDANGIHHTWQESNNPELRSIPTRVKLYTRPAIQAAA